MFGQFVDRGFDVGEVFQARNGVVGETEIKIPAVGHAVHDSGWCFEPAACQGRELAAQRLGEPSDGDAEKRKDCGAFTVNASATGDEYVLQRGIDRKLEQAKA